VKVVGQQGPGIAGGLRILENISQSLQELISVGILPEYRSFFNAPDHDVVQGAGAVDSRFPWHSSSLSDSNLSCQHYNLTASPFTHVPFYVPTCLAINQQTYHFAEEMKMIGKESPGKNINGLFFGQVSQSGNKIFPIFVGYEDIRLFNSPPHYMVQNSRGV